MVVMCRSGGIIHYNFQENNLVHVVIIREVNGVSDAMMVDGHGRWSVV